ncbi:MAG: ATP-binding cassette domain-containing protein [Myxococcota bacterium]|nr:ATP-binding cassette domain-containing protein [Myxococcota bacterium]
MGLLQGHGLGKFVGSERTAIFREVQVSIERGQWVTVCGGSGSGKTSLLQILSGLDPQSAGEVIFGESCLYTMPEKNLARLRNRKFGFVFQSFELLERYDIRTNIALPAWVAGDDTDDGRVDELLDQVGLAVRKTREVWTLSGGEKQRVALARALYHTPEILFCDEPTGSLDDHSKSKVMACLKKVKEAGMAVFFVTHESSLESLSDQTLVLKDGRLV